MHTLRVAVGGSLSSQGSAVDFATYQREARETSKLRLGGPQAAIAPMLGLASETGSILNVYKKYLRDGIDLAANREFVREELGDLLWYVAAVATACGLDLQEIAEANLRRTRDRYPVGRALPPFDTLPVFDTAYQPAIRSCGNTSSAMFFGQPTASHNT